MRAESLRGQSDAETTKQRPIVHNESRLTPHTRILGSSVACKMSSLSSKTRVCVHTSNMLSPLSLNVMLAASEFRSCGGRDQAHSGTVGRRPRTKPENEFLDPPVFIGVGLLFFGIGRGADLGGVEEVFEDEVFEAEDGPAGRRVCRCLSRGPSNCQSMPCCFLSCAKFSLRASRSSFDLAIFSGWWYSTTGLG